jgi:hypothetical protein
MAFTKTAERRIKRAVLTVERQAVVGLGQYYNPRDGGRGQRFTGVYFFKGQKYTLNMASAKAYWYHDASDNTANWSDGPMATTMPDNQYWRETATCGAVVYILC